MSVPERRWRSRGIVIDRMGLVLPDDLSLEDWIDIGRDLVSDIEELAWKLGEWLRHGRWRYGEMYEVALNELGLE